MMTGLIVIGAMVALYVLSRIWYHMKLQCLRSNGRTEAVITKISEYSRKNNKKEKCYFYQYTAEYNAEGRVYKLHRNVPKRKEMYEGYKLDILYDDKHPRRFVLTEELADPEAAIRKWKLVPIATACICVVMFIFLIPMIFGFSKRNSDIYEDGIQYAIMIAAAGSVVWKFGAKDRKEHGLPWRTLFVLLFWIAFLAVYFRLVFAEYFV